VCLSVSLFVCPNVIQEKTVKLFCTTIYIYIYSTYFKKKLYILLHNNIYSTYFKKKKIYCFNRYSYLHCCKTIKTVAVSFLRNQLLILRFSTNLSLSVRITAVSKHLKKATINILYLVTLLESLLGKSPNQEENLSRFQPN
jgi:hypothetical protein